MPAEGGQSTSGPIYKKWGGGGETVHFQVDIRKVGGGGGGGGSPLQVQYTKFGGGQSASGPIPSLLNEDFCNCLIGVRKL